MRAPIDAARVLVPILGLAASACGGAAPLPVLGQPEPIPVMATVAPTFAGHGTLQLRSVPPGSGTDGAAPLTHAQPPLYAELAADGSVTGTRCGAMRFTDDGVLEREGEAVARIDGGTIRAEPGDDDLGWSIVDAVLSANGARFAFETGRITPSDPELPAVDVTPADADARLVLAFFATLLVCDDLGP